MELRAFVRAANDGFMTVFIFDVKYLSCFYFMFGFLQNLCKV